MTPYISENDYFFVLFESRIFLDKNLFQIDRINGTYVIMSILIDMDMLLFRSSTT